MELCEILTHIYGHNNWYNPLRSIGVSMNHQSPYEAYCELDDSYQRIVESLFGKRPEVNDGLLDESRPIDFTKYCNYES